MPEPTRIVLIHAVTVAMEPVQAAFRRIWPQALLGNLLDDMLSADREADGDLTDAMHERIGRLADYALSTRANGILFTCSAFGPAIERVAERLPIPVFKPNEAMFRAALESGDRIGMLATFPSAVAGMEAEFQELAARFGRRASIETLCVPSAMAALRTGDAASHNRLLADAAPRLQHCDVILLAHFSTSRAEDAVRAASGRPVHTSPGAAVTALRATIEGKS